MRGNRGKRKVLLKLLLKALGTGDYSYLFNRPTRFFLNHLLYLEITFAKRALFIRSACNPYLVEETNLSEGTSADILKLSFHKWRLYICTYSNDDNSIANLFNFTDGQKMISTLSSSSGLWWRWSCVLQTSHSWPMGCESRRENQQRRTNDASDATIPTRQIGRGKISEAEEVFDSFLQIACSFVVTLLELSHFCCLFLLVLCTTIATKCKCICLQRLASNLVEDNVIRLTTLKRANSESKF